MLSKNCLLKSVVLEHAVLYMQSKIKSDLLLLSYDVMKLSQINKLIDIFYIGHNITEPYDQKSFVVGWLSLGCCSSLSLLGCCNSLLLLGVCSVMRMHRRLIKRNLAWALVEAQSC